MQNTCFIIMPSGDPNGYSQGHVNRVYDYIIVPACRLAGFWPTRKDNATHDDPMDMLKEIIDSDVAIFDISANNTVALYGLAIRQALSLPVTVVKDLKSAVNFSTFDLNLIEYDDSLRIDTVQKSIEALSEALKNATETKTQRHAMLDRLGIGIPPVEIKNIFPDEAAEPVISSDTTDEEAEAEKKKPRLPIISPLPDYVGEPLTEEQINKLKPGDEFFHLNHGKGKINFVKKDKLASIQFESGTKFLVLAPSDFIRAIDK